MPCVLDVDARFNPVSRATKRLSLGRVVDETLFGLMSVGLHAKPWDDGRFRQLTAEISREKAAEKKARASGKVIDRSGATAAMVAKSASQLVKEEARAAKKAVVAARADAGRGGWECAP
jgi:hypothetical protein